VLQLMSLFQLGFPLDEDGQRQLVPALLPVEEPSAATEPVARDVCGSGMSSTSSRHRLFRVCWCGPLTSSRTRSIGAAAQAAFLEGRIARPRRQSLAMATFFMVQRRQAFNS
jgi:hypothetical protein